MTKRTKIILITSISLNIILIAFTLGHKLGAFHQKPKTPFEREEKNIIAILPEDKKENAIQTFARIRQIHQNNFDQMQQQMQKIEEQAIAKEFNPKQFLNEFSKSDELMSQTRVETNKEIAKFLSSLTQEEREKVIKEIKNGRHFFGKKPPHFDEKTHHNTNNPAPREINYKASNDD